jgi:sigma-B regulation protein RsbU (phosphoserine phosphatase)
MEIINIDFVRQQLEDRRSKLKEALPRVQNADPLRVLLQEVDGALEKIERGVYGICETCHEPIEAERLIVDPLIRNCLDHLSRAEQRALEHDLDLAGEVQRNLLPKSGLRLHGWETAFHFQPAGAVSGDYCDLIDGGDCLCFFVGDVAGKGVAASILMAHLHAIFRSLLRANHPFEKLTEEANRLFCEGTPSTHFATLVCGRANAQGDVEIANAGHVSPLVIRRDSVEKIAPTGIPLGMFCNSEYSTQKLKLSAGESLVLYSDGVTEARNNSGEFYGEQRLAELFMVNLTRNSNDLVKLAGDDLKTFRSGLAKTDDVTIMVVRRG